MHVVGKQACHRAAVYPRQLCEAIVKGTQIGKERLQETLTAQKKMIDMGLNPATSEGFLYEIELEDMCEEDPSTWEELANERWTEATWPAEETRDSTSGELLDPKKVHEWVPRGARVHVPNGSVGQSHPRKGEIRSRREDRRNTMGVRQERRKVR